MNIAQQVVDASGGVDHMGVSFIESLPVGTVVDEKWSDHEPPHYHSIVTYTFSDGSRVAICNDWVVEVHEVDAHGNWIDARGKK